MSIIKEFKTFALRGNMVDLAIGVVIGAAFGKVVSSLVNDIIMPPIGYLLGGVNFADLAFTIREKTATVPAVQIKYGAFINSIIDFLIVALVIFAVIKVMNRLSLHGPVVDEPTTKECPECKMSIPITAKRCGHCTVPLKE